MQLTTLSPIFLCKHLRRGLSCYLQVLIHTEPLLSHTHILISHCYRSCFQKKNKVAQSIYSLGVLTGEILISLSQSLGNPTTLLFQTHIMSWSVTCHTPWSPFNHSLLHRHSCPNNFISVISQSPHRDTFLPGICESNPTKCLRSPSSSAAAAAPLGTNNVRVSKDID